MRLRNSRGSTTLVTLSVFLSHPPSIHGNTVHRSSSLHPSFRSVSSFTTTTTTTSQTIAFIPSTNHPQQKCHHNTYSFALHDSSSTTSFLPKSITTYNPSNFPPPKSSSWPYTPQDFQRIDEEDDTNFYTTPRFVKHVDEWATLSLQTYYHQQLSDLQMKKGKKLDVLDLCSSWISHLPNNDGSIQYGNVVGVGMNAEELEANPTLTSYYTQNLNTSPYLHQFPDESFDVVFCSLSVDYLIQPRIVFAEIGRVLRSGGVCLITFSNRYFRKKVVQLWLDADKDDDGDDNGVIRNRMDIIASYFHYSAITTTTNEEKTNQEEEEEGEYEWKSMEGLDIQLPRTKDTIYEFITRADLWKWFALAIFRGSWRIDPIYAVKAVKK